jgi:hypothetical protein
MIDGFAASQLLHEHYIRRFSEWPVNRPERASLIVPINGLPTYRQLEFLDSPCTRVIGLVEGRAVLAFDIFSTQAEFCVHMIVCARDGVTLTGDSEFYKYRHFSRKGNRRKNRLRMHREWYTFPHTSENETEG